MNAADVKDALRRRHPAREQGFPGPWTCIEEWMGIDLLAWSAWGSVGNYRRIGYEVKVSRSDLRRELLRPGKRALQVAWCNEFYFAVPRGLLKPNELDYLEPVWEPGDFDRAPCPGPCYGTGAVSEWFIGPLTAWQDARGNWHPTYRYHVDVPCPGCSGRGYLVKSRVEREAPTLWIPRDVGLVVVDGNGCRVLQKSPVRKDVPALGVRDLGQLVRWVSTRPDPRHAGVGVPDPPSTVTGPLDAVAPAC